MFTNQNFKAMTRISLIINSHISDAQVEMCCNNIKEANEHLKIVRKLVVLLEKGQTEISDEQLKKL
jgi:hypothetical protein